MVLLGCTVSLRAEEMRCQNGALRVRQIECKLFDFSDGGHIGSVADGDFGARAAESPSRVGERRVREEA